MSTTDTYPPAALRRDLAGPPWFRRAVDWLDDRGTWAWIGLMVAGFVLFVYSFTPLLFFEFFGKLRMPKERLFDDTIKRWAKKGVENRAQAEQNYQRLGLDARLEDMRQIVWMCVGIIIAFIGFCLGWAASDEERWSALDLVWLVGLALVIFWGFIAPLHIHFISKRVKSHAEVKA